MPSYWRVVTSHGKTLSVEVSSGFVVDAEISAGDDYRPLLAIVLDNTPGIAFLSAESVSAIPIALEARDYRSILLPLKLVQLAQADHLAFLHPAGLRQRGRRSSAIFAAPG